MKVQFLVHSSTLNLLCQLWTHIVNSDPCVSSFDPITQQGGVITKNSVFRTIVNFEPFVSIRNLNCQFFTLFVKVKNNLSYWSQVLDKQGY